MLSSEKCLSVRDLRRRWKPAKERLIAASPDHPTVIRLHRAFSWLARCEQSADGEDLDLVLVCQWIAFNGLYGQWDAGRREPLADRQCWRVFLDAVLKIDGSGHVASMLNARRELLMSILDDEYLSAWFWEEPTDARAGKARKAKFEARTWYIESRWPMLLERVVERIYLLRCQLVHGAATFGGKLNRDSLARCIAMLRCVLDAVLLVVIDHGEDFDWGDMCYPPLN